MSGFRGTISSASAPCAKLSLFIVKCSIQRYWTLRIRRLNSSWNSICAWKKMYVHFMTLHGRTQFSGRVLQEKFVIAAKLTFHVSCRRNSWMKYGELSVCLSRTRKKSYEAWLLFVKYVLMNLLSIDWLIDWLIDSVSAGLIDWLIDWSLVYWWIIWNRPYALGLL